MSGGIRSALCIMVLGTSCIAQEGLTIQHRSKEKVQEAEVQKLYVSACAVVRQEFHDSHLNNPAVTLVVGADKDEMVSQEREIRLVRWNPYLFAQGVVMLAISGSSSSRTEGEYDNSGREPGRRERRGAAAGEIGLGLL